MSTSNTFSEEAIKNAIDTAKRAHEASQSSNSDFEQFALTKVAMPVGCINATIQNHQVCVTFPIINKQFCVSVPVSFSGEAQACGSVCFSGFKPSGIVITIKVNGVIVASHTFGTCS